MNNLNSVILEGIIKKDTIRLDENKISFMLSNEKFYKEGDEFKKESCYIKTILFSKFPDDVIKTIKNTQVIRIIGKLRAEANGSIYIYTDCYETAPARY